jgi:hypothetical protein
MLLNDATKIKTIAYEIKDQLRFNTDTFYKPYL